MENTKMKKVEKPTVLQSVELQKYILETSVYPREPLPLKELREATAKHHLAFFSTTPDSGQLLAMLLKLLDAKKTIEIGVYTGYSLLLTALTIPDDGKLLRFWMMARYSNSISSMLASCKITAIDINRDTYEIGLPIIRNAGVEHKIDFIKSLALPALDKLLEDESNEGSFDFGFVDANKNDYLNYHERMMKLLKIGGMVIYDNTLWGGTVAGPIEDAPVSKQKWYKDIIEFNKFIAADHRVELCMASVGDGMTICRRLH